MELRTGLNFNLTGHNEPSCHGRLTPAPTQLWTWSILRLIAIKPPFRRLGGFAGPSQLQRLWTESFNLEIWGLWTKRCVGYDQININNDSIVSTLSNLLYGIDAIALRPESECFAPWYIFGVFSKYTGFQTVWYINPIIDFYMEWTESFIGRSSFEKLQYADMYWASS